MKGAPRKRSSFPLVGSRIGAGDARANDYPPLLGTPRLEEVIEEKLRLALFVALQRTRERDELRNGG